MEGFQNYRKILFKGSGWIPGLAQITFDTRILLSFRSVKYPLALSEIQITRGEIVSYYSTVKYLLRKCEGGSLTLAF